MGMEEKKKYLTKLAKKILARDKFNYFNYLLMKKKSRQGRFPPIDVSIKIAELLLDRGLPENPYGWLEMVFRKEIARYSEGVNTTPKIGLKSASDILKNIMKGAD